MTKPFQAGPGLPSGDSVWVVVFIVARAVLILGAAGLLLALYLGRKC